MAAQPQSDEVLPPSAQEVGFAFVQQYYHVLQQSPELVHRFYQEGSKLGRPDALGVVTEITTAYAINEKLLSMGSIRAELKTVDAQESLGNGVIVLVTGYLTGEDNVKKDFLQSFFLAPQYQGCYYVLNDILRFVEEVGQQQVHQGLANGTTALHVPEDDLPSEQEQHTPDETVPLPVDEKVIDGEVNNPLSDNGEVVEEPTGEVIDMVEPTVEVIEENPNNSQTTVVQSNAVSAEVIEEVPNNTQATVVQSNVITSQEEMPKKSYASIVKSMKDNAFTAVSVRAPKPIPMKREQQATPAPAQASDMPKPSSVDVKGSNVQDTEDGYSIYVKNLSLDASPAQLAEEFKKHGPIKPDGIQVRSNKMQGFCFGFVEFEVASAVQSAIEASPILIGGRQAYVEEKRSTGSRVGNRGRFAPAKGGGYPNDGRGRGTYGGGGGGRGYSRDFNNRADFGGRGSRGASSNRGGRLASSAGASFSN